MDKLRIKVQELIRTATDTDHPDDAVSAYIQIMKLLGYLEKDWETIVVKDDDS